MKPAAEKLSGELGRIRFRDPKVPVLTNVDAEPNTEGARIAGLLHEQVTAAVRFTESIHKLAALGVRRVVEIGPGHVLGALVARIDRKLQRSSAGGMDELNAVAIELAEGA